MKNWIYIFIFILILAVGAWWLTPWFTSTPVVDIHLYGTSFDDATREVEDTLQIVRMKFGDRVRVTVHYLALRDQENNLASILGEVAQRDVARGSMDRAENARRLVMQQYNYERFWQYLAFRNSNLMNNGWMDAALRAGFDPHDIEARVAREGKQLQIAEIEAWDRLIAEERTPIDGPLFPRLMIGGRSYRGVVDAMSITSAVARALIHDEATSIFGVTGCTADADCDDRPTERGRCEDTGTLRARCTYAMPSPVNLVVLFHQPFDPNEDPVLDGLRRYIKGLTVTLIDVKSKEGVQLKKDIQATVFPAYLFDQSIRQEPNYYSFLQNGLIAAEKGGWYHVNVQRGKNK
ncbi:hypothetical protein HY629_01575 [Candidatus Uhrbacteria bacterium]|nr:hypothetical protein [Candidatus Uhrbacteria bacterium]